MTGKTRRASNSSQSSKSARAPLTRGKLPAIAKALDTTGATEAVTTDRKGGAAPLPVRAAPLSLLIPTPPSLNDCWGNNKHKGGRGRFKTKVYKDWISAALWNIARQDPHHFDMPVVVFAAVKRDSLSADIDNRSKPILDILKAAKIYTDDSRSTAIAFTWSLTETRLLIVPATQTWRVRFMPAGALGFYGGWYLDRSQEDEHA